MPIDPTVLLNYRLAVARIGERDLFHWWESNALTEEGQFALRRLFRHSFVPVAIELAIEAARFRHEKNIPPGNRITLFNLGDEIDELFRSWINHAKAENRVEVFQILSVPDTARRTVADALIALNVPIEEGLSGTLGDRAIHVAEIDEDELRNNTLRLVHMFLAAYAQSDRERFLVPYATLRPAST